MIGHPSLWVYWGIDVVTEDAYFEPGPKLFSATQDSEPVDGASRVAQLLSEADEIKIVTGLRINPAHQNPDLPQGLNLRAGTVKQLAAILRDQGKVVDVEWL